MTLTKAQQQAVKAKGAPLFIQAGAGTGKTFTLAQRLAWGLSAESGKLIRSVANLLTITFTDKAAGELLARVRFELRRQGLTEAALDIDAAWISTIHAMCKRILSAHAFEAGTDPGADTLSEQESADLLAIAVDEVLGQGKADGRMRELCAFYGTEAVCNLVGKISSLVVLCPKELGGFDCGPAPRKAKLAILTDLGACVRAVVCELDELKAPEGTKTEQKCYATIVRTLEILDGAIAKCNCSNEQEHRAGTFTWANIAKALMACKPAKPGAYKKACKAAFDAYNDALVSLQVEAQASMLYEWLMVVLEFAGEVAQRYRALKRARCTIDMNDMLIETYRLLEHNPNLAARYCEQFDSVMVDEFQDTDMLQASIIEKLTDAKMSTLTTVGDAQQSIYAFRGGDLAVYQDVRAAMDERGSTELKLDVNFRSHSDILGFVKDIFKTETFFGNDFLEVDPCPNSRGELSWVASDAPRVHMVFSAGYVNEDNKRQATSVADLRSANARTVADLLVRTHSRGASYGQMALVLRSTRHAGPYIAALQARGVPCVISGGSMLYESTELKTLARLLRVLADRDDDEALFGLLGSPMFDLGDDDLLEAGLSAKRSLRLQEGDVRKKPSLFDAIEKLAKDEKTRRRDSSSALRHAYTVLVRALDRLWCDPLSTIVMRAVHDSGWLDDLRRKGAEGGAVFANIQRLVDMLDDFEAKHGRCVYKAAEHFSTMCDLVSKGSSARGKPGTLVTQGNEAVRVMTIHAAKGLEFPIVVVAEFDSSKARSHSVEPIAQTEDGVRHLTLSPNKCSFGATKLADLDEAGSFLAAHTTQDFLAHACALAALRERQEAQRLLYVALTRAREMLVVVGHDARYGTKGTLGQGGLFADLAGELFGQTLPESGSIVRLASGELVSVTLNYVPFAPQKKMKLAQIPCIEHSLPAFEPILEVSAAPQLVEKFSSYTSIAHRHEKKSPEYPLVRDRFASTDAASSFGSAFHALAQWAIDARVVNQELLNERLHAMRRRFGLSHDELVRLDVALQKWFSSKRFRQALTMPRHFSEHAFAVSVDGVPLEGYIDLLCIDSDVGHGLIIDYKTGMSGQGQTELLRARYQLQAACYAYAVLVSGLVDTVELVFVRPETAGEEIVFFYDAHQLDELKTIILA